MSGSSTNYVLGIDYRTGFRNLPYATNIEVGHHPMVLLSKDPDKIDQIPELAGEPELRNFIAAVNGPGVPMESFRCDHRTKQTASGVERNLYVAFLFRDRAMAADARNYLAMAGNLVSEVEREQCFIEGEVPFQINLARHRMREDGDAFVYTVDINMDVQGGTEADMRADLARRLDILLRAISREV